MVVNFLTNSSPITAVGLASKFEITAIVREDEAPQPLETFNINDYDCCYDELALADLVDDANFKNDKAAFYFKKSLPSDTLEIKLFKCENGAEVEKAVLNDNTYGQLFGLPYFGDEVRVGFLLEWRLVLAAFGTGTYYVEANRAIIDRNSTVRTHNFQLFHYNEMLANKTVRIETVSRGCIEGGNDYTGNEVNWLQMARLKGKFWNPQATFESDNYQDSDRNIQQIQDSIVTNYNLDLEPLPVDIAKPLIYDKLLANEIRITDYNLFNYDRYQDFAVYPVEVSNSAFYNRSGNGLFSFVFTDKKQNIIKRNYK